MSGTDIANSPITVRAALKRKPERVNSPSSMPPIQRAVNSVATEYFLEGSDAIANYGGNNSLAAAYVTAGLDDNALTTRSASGCWDRKRSSRRMNLREPRTGNGSVNGKSIRYEVGKVRDCR